MHILDLSVKLITLILTYGGLISGFSQPLQQQQQQQQQQQEAVHLQICKKLLDDKKDDQNDFVNGELGYHC